MKDIVRQRRGQAMWLDATATIGAVQAGDLASMGIMAG